MALTSQLLHGSVIKHVLDQEQGTTPIRLAIIPEEFSAKSKRGVTIPENVHDRITCAEIAVVFVALDWRTA